MKQELRRKLFVEQIKPVGRFGLTDDGLYNTGNGEPAIIGWIEKYWGNNLPYQYEELTGRNDYRGCKFEGHRSLAALNFAPPLGRGISWSFEADSWINIDSDKVLNEKRENDSEF